MPNDAPDVTGAVTFYHVSMRFIDASGDKRAVSLQVATADYTAAKVQALAVALGAATNASLYEVDIKQVFNSVPDKDNADNLTKDSVFDNFAVLMKNTNNDSKDVFIPAPIAALFIGDGAADEIDPASTELAAVLSAALALESGYTIVSARYTERREINTAVPI